MIRTNLSALTSQNKLQHSRNTLTTALERLSSGLRINGAADDAAGQAIGNRLQAQITGQTQAARNANDGISLSQTAQGALGEVNQRLQRIRELSVQGLNELYNGEMGDKIQAEINLNLKEIDRLNGMASFNGIPLLDGRGGTRQLQIGANDRETLSVNLNPPGFSVQELGLEDLTIQGAPDRITLRNTLSGNSSRILLDDPSTTLTYSGYGADKNPNLVRAGSAQLVQLEGESGRLVEESISARHDTDTRLSTVNIFLSNPTITTTTGRYIYSRQYLDSSGDPLSLSGAAIVSSGGKYWIEHDHAGSKHYYEAALTFESNGNKMTAQAVSDARVARADLPSSYVYNLNYAPQIAKNTADYSLTLDGNDESANADLKLVYLGGEYYIEELAGASYAYYKANVTIETDGAGPGTNSISVVANRSSTIGSVVDEPRASGTTTAHLKPANANLQVNYEDYQGQVFHDVMGPDQETGYVFNLNEFVNGGGAYKTATVVTNQKGEYLLQTVNGPAEVFLYYPLSFSVSTNVENNLTTILLRENGEARRLRNPPLPLEAIDAAIARVDAKRSELGALDNRLASVIEGTLTTRNNLDAAKSRIMDADYAREVASMTRAQILQQAGTSVLAQANQIPQGVLSLLK